MHLNYPSRDPYTLFGGFKQSGIGRELGPAGLQEYREAKHIWQNIAQQRGKLAKDSLKLWESWLRLAPARLSARDRELLGEFAAVLRLLVQSDEANQRAGKHVFAQYYKLFPSLVNMLSCWAVTSLSTRGRVPLEPGFFDLVMVDECHRSGFGDWFPMLEYFGQAYQLGLTATPREIEQLARPLTPEELRRDTYVYFTGSATGEPAYTYSLKQAIEDGYLVPYLLEERLTNLDEDGYVSPDGTRYATANFERDIRLPEDLPSPEDKQIWEHKEDPAPDPVRDRSGCGLR